jgi:hypothetical protein
VILDVGILLDDGEAVDLCAVNKAPGLRDISLFRFF